MDALPGFAAAEQEWVYYMTDFLHVKIGTSADVQRRSGQLQLEILFRIPGGQLVEKREHRRWSALRIGRTEYFNPNAPMLLYMALRVDRSDTVAVRSLEWLSLNIMTRIA